MMTVARQFSTTTTVIHRVASLSEGGPRSAPFQFEDDVQQLQFDGRFEDCVLSNVSSSSGEGLFKSIDQLAPVFQDGTLAKTRERLENEEVVKVDLGTDRKWTATLQGDQLEFRNGVSSLEVFSDRAFRLSVRADLAKIQQEIGGSYNPQTGTITVDSEQVQVTTGQV